MKGSTTVFTALSVLIGVSSIEAQDTATPPMTFFVTSSSIGDGANLGGLSGADNHCQSLAAAAGAGMRSWRAYLSTQGSNAVNARERIGQGPWHNAKGNLIAEDLTHLHGLTSSGERRVNQINKENALDEYGNLVEGVGDTGNRHDILTGTRADGTAFTDHADHTCQNWLSNSEDGGAQVGHHDHERSGDTSDGWVSVHLSKGCSQEKLLSTGGEGLFYCFASD